MGCCVFLILLIHYKDVLRPVELKNAVYRGRPSRQCWCALHLYSCDRSFNQPSGCRCDALDESRIANWVFAQRKVYLRRRNHASHHDPQPYDERHRITNLCPSPNWRRTTILCGCGSNGEYPHYHAQSNGYNGGVYFMVCCFIIMDLNTLASAGLSTTAILVIYGIYRLCLVLVGRRFVSQCCENEVRVGINVEEFTPPSEHPTRSQTHLHQHLHAVGFRSDHNESHSEPLLLHHQESQVGIDIPQPERDAEETISLVSTVSSTALPILSPYH